ncbi:MAG: hypothetical protein WCW33_03455 [Candidatus Babeliales bacterium]
MIAKRLFLIGCVMGSCFSLSADFGGHQNNGDASQKTTELLLVQAERDSQGDLHVIEACHCTPKNIIDLVRMVRIPADKRQDFAEDLLDAMSGQSGE